ncbi:hypothetical protein AY599_14940 [Leptolyngbya valderiana BDU 20041]|nr:hypothetical protein AY599_14940 [Leptolyngbya valderiana BDU 20041]
MKRASHARADTDSREQSPYDATAGVSASRPLAWLPPPDCVVALNASGDHRRPMREIRVMFEPRRSSVSRVFPPSRTSIAEP